MTATTAPKVAKTPAVMPPRRHKCFDDTHRDLIGTAVRLISERGVESLSISAVARAMGINRTTVYYHFDSREALIAAVKAWSAEQLSKGLATDLAPVDRVEYIIRFVLENPDLIKLWIDDMITGGGIRSGYPRWDELVAGIREAVAATDPGEPVDAEVYAVVMLAGGIIGARVFRSSVCPQDDTETVIRRFTAELQRMLRHSDLPQL